MAFFKLRCFDFRLGRFDVSYPKLPYDFNMIHLLQTPGMVNAAKGTDPDTAKADPPVARRALLARGDRPSQVTELAAS
jgi:hypothetical protein